jgi:hypothetical protein
MSAFGRKRTFAVLTDIIGQSTMNKFSFLLFGICSTLALADPDDAEYKTVLTLTMAAFYTVDSEGRSQRESAPVVAVIANPKASSSGPAERLRATSKQKVRQKNTKSSRVSATKQANHDPFDAYRCERHGFYYTQDGRCILPVLGRKERPMRHRKRSF